MEDAGLQALALGCAQLEVLLLAGCDAITGRGLRALLRHGRSLHTLYLTGSKHLGDKDLESLSDSPLRYTLTSIDLSGCSRIGDRGAQAIGSAVGSGLSTLCLSKTAVTDYAAVLLSSLCSKLRSLDLSFCAAITKNTVTSVVQGVTGLTTLKLDGAQYKIDSRFLAAQKLRFATLAMHWFGYQPMQVIK